MYKLEIQTNNTVKRIENPRKVKVVDMFYVTVVKVMDGNRRWIKIGHTFYYQRAELIKIAIQFTIEQQKTFIQVNLN